MWFGKDGKTRVEMGWVLNSTSEENYYAWSTLVGLTVRNINQLAASVLVFYVWNGGAEQRQHQNIHAGTHTDMHAGGFK